GNMVVIIAALLFGGVQGGLAGAVGMGLNDLFNGYADTALKTVILKFGIGIVVGLVASRGTRKDAKSPAKYTGILSAIFIAAGAVVFAVISTVGQQIKVEGSDKPLVLVSLLYIFCFVLGIILAVAAAYSRKLTVELQYVVLGATMGIVFNLFGEFVFGAIWKMLAGSQFVPAVIASVISIPSTLINGTASVIGAVLLYLPLKKAVSRIR
ncbi:MAG: ECF transporter S component, partial [Bacillota bacterium]|nr:ECF transporter S component [Bacillota bacterium]